MQHSVSAPTIFNQIQLDLLNMFAHTNDEKTLADVRQILSEYFAKKAEEGMNELWEKGLWNNEKNEEILKDHLRTPYETKNSFRH